VDKSEEGDVVALLGGGSHRDSHVDLLGGEDLIVNGDRGGTEVITVCLNEDGVLRPL
jgi:hypothetical protein